MNEIKIICERKGVTRLCHFTQSRNLAHLFGDSLALYSTKRLKQMGMPYNPSDSNRYDGRDDLICCSIEYPNVYYFEKARRKDNLFRDWVVLFVDSKYIWDPNTYFCSCNAARGNGSYIKKGITGFRSLYTIKAGGSGIQRSKNHLLACPTDIQAEVLVNDPIYLNSILGIAVKNDEQAEEEILRFELQGIDLNVPLVVAPEFFKAKELTDHIRRGVRVKEKLFCQ